jgi:cell wall-associated NlpC family hydrolase
MSELRQRIVEEARSFLGTPCRSGGLVKGVNGGVDCGSFVYLVLKNCGLLSEEFIAAYPSDWWMHTSEERYLLRMLRYGQKMLETVGYPTFHAQPGDVVIARAAGSRVYNHGGIVTDWPHAIHAKVPMVCETTITRDCIWSHCDLAWFDVASRVEEAERVR